MADPAELIAHLKDTDAFHLPLGLTIHIPQPFEGIGLHLTKFMVVELAVAVAMVAIFVPVGRKIATGPAAQRPLVELF